MNNSSEKGTINPDSHMWSLGSSMMSNVMQGEPQTGQMEQGIGQQGCNFEKERWKSLKT